MRPATATARAIVEELRGLGNAERAAFMAEEYATTNLTHLGCTAPDVRRIARSHARALRAEPARALEVAHALVAQRNHDARLVAYELLGALPAARDGLRAETLALLADGNDNWAAVDAFCSTLSGPLYAKGSLAPSVLDAWARSRDPWRRRAALATVATAFQRAALRTSSPVEPSVRVCARLVDDRHDHVVKALSWALRNLASRDRTVVERFLTDHGPRLAARVRREVTTKLATGKKS